LIQREGFAVSPAVPMAAGDASFHSGWVIHGAGRNTSTRPRMAMTVIYVEDGAVISEPDSPERQHDLATWLPGQRPGDAVGSPINPRLD
jgi:ectoine hydroxylase-related dioxygenase (phytanoyl-CoA dioxygenase family)